MTTHSIGTTGGRRGPHLRHHLAGRSRSSLAFIGIAVVLCVVAGIAAIGFATHTRSSSVPAVAPGIAVGQSDSGSGSAVSVPGTLVPGTSGSSVAAPAKEAPGASSSIASGTGSATAGAPAGAAPRVVRTGQSDVVVRRGGVPAAMEALSASATGSGGFVAASSSSGGDSASANVTLRVPVGSFDKLVAAAARLGTVRSSSTSSQDVTGAYVDLSARLSALTATRATYLTMLSKATTIGDTLAVQQRLDDVQTQIEQLQGQQKVLADSSDLATLTVTLSEQGAPSTVPRPAHSGISGAFGLAWDRFTGGLRVIIGLLGPLALIVLLGGVFVGGALLVRRFTARRTAP